MHQVVGAPVPSGRSVHQFRRPRRGLPPFDHKLAQIKKPVDLIVLPEVFNTGFPVDPEKFAEPLNSVTVNWMSEKAKQFKAVITGSFLMSDEGKFYNQGEFMQKA